MNTKMKKYVVITFIILLSISSIAQEHNFLLHTNANVSRLKEQIKSDPKVKKAWENQLKKAEDILKQEKLNPADLQELGLVYRMTNESRFAEFLKKILLNTIAKKSWEGQELLNRTPAWRGGLGTAHTSYYMAIGFDCVYNYLSNVERSEIADGIVRLGIKPALNDWLNPETNIHTFDTMGHNWWSACVDMAGFAALAVKNEIPEASKWAKEILEINNEWLHFSGNVMDNKPMTFGRDGGFYESINYANFGFSQYLLFRYAFKNTYPKIKLPETPEMEKMADFFIQTTYYTKDSPMSVNFGDGSLKRNGNACILLLWNLGLQKERYAWYLQKTMDGNDKEGLEIDSPQGLILHPDLSSFKKNTTPDIAESKLFSDLGWATLRNSWKDDATMLGVKSGITWNHAHADAGSFILFHKGKNLIIDSGNSTYGRPEYTEFYCQSEAHNVALFNGKAQNKKDAYFGVKNEGHLYNLLDTENLKYIYADATGPTSQWFSRNFRHFLWVGNVILVLDDLESFSSGKFEWLLHYNGVSKRNGLDLSIKQDDAEVVVRPLYPETFPDGGLPHDFPEKMRLEEKVGLKDHEPDVKQPYWSISHFQETNRTKFISAILLKNEESKGKLPIIERFEGKDFLGVRITQNGETTEIYLNLLADGRIKHRNSLNVMNGWDTDAYLMALTFSETADKSNPDNIKKLFISDGSYLRNDGKTIIHGLSKFFTIVDYNTKTPKLQFQGQDGVTISLLSDKLNSIMVNGEAIRTYYDEERKVSKFTVKK